MFMLTACANPLLKNRRVPSTRQLFTVSSLTMDFCVPTELDCPLSSHPRNTAAGLLPRGGRPCVSHPSGNKCQSGLSSALVRWVTSPTSTGCDCQPHQSGEFLSQNRPGTSPRPPLALLLHSRGAVVRLLLDPRSLTLGFETPRRPAWTPGYQPGPESDSYVSPCLRVWSLVG